MTTGTPTTDQLDTTITVLNWLTEQNSHAASACIDAFEQGGLFKNTTERLLVKDAIAKRQQTIIELASQVYMIKSALYPVASSQAERVEKKPLPF